MRLTAAGVRAVARDVTGSFARRRTLVVAPHPDDETFGCGAAIARMRALGTAVDVAFVSAGGRSPRPADMPLEGMLLLRRAESARALGILGVEEPAVTHLDFDDGAMPERRHDIADALEGLLRARSPEQVLVTSARDRHPDHAAVAGAVRVAASRCALSLTVYEYPIWQRAPALTVLGEAARGAGRRPAGRSGRLFGRPCLVRTDEFLDLKKRAVQAYESQLPHLPVGFVEDFLLPFETFVRTVVPDPVP